MNKITLFVGAATMVVMGIGFAVVGNNGGFMAWIAVGLGLMWMGLAVEP